MQTGNGASKVAGATVVRHGQVIEASDPIKQKGDSWENADGSIRFSRPTGRVAVTEDGYSFTEQPDGTWTDGDQTFNSIDDLFSADPKLTIDGKIYSPKAWRDEEAKGGLNPTDPDVRFSRGSDQTETPKFKKWYGDWQNAGNETQGHDASGRVEDVNSVQRRGSLEEDHPVPIRVGEALFAGASGPVGKDGAPMVIYHGTRDTVTTFDLDHPNRKDMGWLGRGIYGTSSSDLADTYAYLKRGNGAEKTMALYLAVKNPFVATNEVKMKYKNASQEAIDRFTQRLKDQRHDGVVMEFDDGHIELVAFEPTQVKSATDNNGDFDATNPDIRFSRGPLAAARDTLAAARELNLAAGYKLGDLLKFSSKTGWWDRTVGTQFNLAQRNKEFKRVYDGVQTFLSDVSTFASRAANLAPTMLPQLNTLAGARLAGLLNRVFTR